MKVLRLGDTWLRRSLYRRLLIFNTITVATALVVLGYLSLHTGQTSLRREIEQSNRRLAIFAANDVSAQYDTIINEARRLRSQLAGSDISVQAQAMLELRLAAPHVYRALYLFDSDGQLVVHLNDRLEDLLLIQNVGEFISRDPIPLSDVVRETYTQTLAEREYQSSVKITGIDQVPVVHMGIQIGPMVSQQRQIVVAEIDLRVIWQRVDEINVGQTGRAYVVSSEGIIIAHPDRRYVGQPIASSLTSVLDGYQGQTEYRDLITDRTMLSAYSPVGKQSGWGIVVEQELEEAMAPVNAIAYTTLGALLIALVVVVIVAVKTAQSVTWPLQSLANVTQSIAQTGNLDLQVTVAGHDEVSRLAAAFNEMISNLRQAEREIRQLNTDLEQRVIERTTELNSAKKQVEAILNNSSDAIILSHPNGTILRSNDTFKQIFGYSNTAILGQPLTMLFDQAYLKHITDTIHTLIDTNQPQRLEITACRANDSVFDADLALSPIKNEDAQLQGIVCSVRDITLHKRLERSLHETLEHERELSAIKSQVIESVSHEFRTPLALIQSTSEILVKYGGQLSDKQRHDKHAIISQGILRMVDLLDDALALNQSPANPSSLEPVPVDFDLFCQTILQSDSFAKDAARIHYASAGACANVILDQTLARQIVSQVLENAVKFSPPESIIRFDLHCEDNRIVLKICNEGIGIPEVDQPHIFDMFYRARNVGTTPGTGLGLAIAKQNIDLLEGTINVESRESSHTQIIIMLPITRA